LKEAIAAKKQLLRSWRKALASFNPQQAALKNKAVGK